jgi:hypothetical protein
VQRKKGERRKKKNNDEADGSHSTPERVQLLMKLQSIFMPYARKQWDRLYGNGAASGAAAVKGYTRFVHYTSAEAALKIIKTKRLWMRNTTCMSDYLEVHHGYEILRNVLAEKAEAFVEALDAGAPGAAQEAIALFDGWWSNIQLDTFIASMSEHDDAEDAHGRLSMWRAFGGVSARVAIVLRVPLVSRGADALRLVFSPVAYFTEDQTRSEISRVIDNIRANRDFLRSLEQQMVINTVFEMLLMGVVCLKHEGFREEREWRAVYCPQLRSSALMESSTEIVGGIPQRVYKLPLEEKVDPVLADLDLAHRFDRLIVGPSPYPWVMRQVFTEALANLGVADAASRVVASDIPIRA